ncbi:acyl-CoA dehydrogenase [Pseudonocardia sulfidoxydans NBRC 16205]|uniref:Acyl-CoA dehydrogenase n=1 Tax=Pseudonocardia sulfidoxydans NBRC 16205 TaxID=1223511 RepID=A0A511D8V5_9PSEU|nr:acyl-CoA dehydrogenase family protein [Pseudonocardia sulfidoxydans]GEL21221.1 acyl-CoA dehydrogenase [Pseudonocardia sulfidoxydans NBRC 16205]
MTYALPCPPERALLAEAASRFARDHSPVEALRTSDVGAPAPGGYHRAAGELGWFAMLVPAELGGGSVSESPLADVVAIAVERGANLQPGPFTAMNVVAESLGLAGSALQREEVLPALVEGRRTATWAVTDGCGRWAPGAAVSYAVDGDAFVLDGFAVLVEEAATADWVLVQAGSPSGVTIFVVPTATPGLEVAPREGLDVTRRFGAVRFTGVRVGRSAVVGEPGRGGELAVHQLCVAAVLTAADAVGAMTRDFGTTLEYARTRVAFGRPIGSFQAVKHLLADTSLALEACQAILAAAADAYGTPGFTRYVAVAKAYIGDAAITLGQNCLQVLGGIGYTWEHEHHLYMRRMTADAFLFGDPGAQRASLWPAYGLGEVA